MGTIAKTVADAGCEVTGFLPEFFIEGSRQSRFIGLIKLLTVNNATKYLVLVSTMVVQRT